MSDPAPIQLPPPRPLGEKMPEYLIGVDLGKAQDHTAVAVIEVRGEGRPIFRVRHLERYPLMTAYQAVARSVNELKRHPSLRRFQSTVVADATGVGKPVMEMFHEQGLDPVEVTITHGYSVTKARGRPEYNVSKSVLVSAINLVIQDGRLKVAHKLPLAKTFITEANQFKVNKSPSGEATYEAWRAREHDDLVLAVAIAVWYGESELVGLPAGADAPWADEKRAWRKERRSGSGRQRYFGELPKPKSRGRRGKVYG